MSIDEFTGFTVNDGVRAARRPRTDAEVSALREDRAATKAAEVGLIRTRYGASANGHLARAADLAVAAKNRRMNPEEWKEFDHKVGQAVRAARQDRDLGELEERFAARVTSEPRTYGEGSPNSWFGDRLALEQRGDPAMVASAGMRMTRYAAEVGHEIRQRSPEGRRAERLVAEECRQIDLNGNRREVERRVGELRAITSGGGATASAAGGGGAAFVTPAFLDQLWAPYIQRAPFANACTVNDVPESGLDVYLPQIESDAAMAQQTAEGNALAETDPSIGFLSTTLETIGGKVTPSQQLYDRSGGSGGIAFDQVVARQLGLDYARQLDLYALNTVLATAGAWTYNGAWALAGTSGVGGFVDRLSAAKQAIRNTPGAGLEPSAVFFLPPRWEYIAGWADAQGRPIVLPQATPPDVRKYGCTGLEWGGLDVWTDPNIPTFGTGTTDQAVVADPTQVYLWRSPTPIIETFVQPGAASLNVTIRAYGYTGCIARYPSAVQVISGSAMTTPVF